MDGRDLALSALRSVLTRLGSCLIRPFPVQELSGGVGEIDSFVFSCRRFLFVQQTLTGRTEISNVRGDNSGGELNFGGRRDAWADS